MDSEKIDYEELTLTVTLLVVIFTVLYGVNNYFYNNIIDLKSGSVIVAIYYLVAVLFFEFFSLFSFLLTKGYLASFPEDQLLKLRKINKFLHRLSFGCPIFILITFILFIPYFYYVVILHPQLHETIKSFILILIFVFATLISAQILCDLRFNFNFAYLKWRFIKIFSDIFNRQNQVEWSKGIIIGFLALISEFFILAIIMIGLIFAPTFLLYGAYSIDITNPPNSDTMSIIILDTGIPSNRCFIHLSQINDTNMELFHEFDDIILVESEFNTSDYMYGSKEEGIWHLFINTSNIPSGYYLIEADVTYINIQNYRARKYDAELFYLN